MTTQLATLEVRALDGLVQADVTGEIDMSNADDLARAISAQLKNDNHGLVLDLTHVTYLDSAAIHSIYEMRERLANRNLRFALVVPPEAPTQMALRLTGVPEAVPVFATAAEAAAALGG